MSSEKKYISHKWLPSSDPWSTPFAQALLHHLDLFEGASVLDIAAGGGIPSFYIADRVGSKGMVLGIDIHQRQVLRARTLKGNQFPWLNFEVGDMRFLPPTLPQVDRITGNLSFMFFRPNRKEALENLIQFLKPKGQLVLTFPSLGTFDSLWNRVREEMDKQNLTRERKKLEEYIDERPSASQVKQWMNELSLEKVVVEDWPLEVATGPGREFLEHPLLRSGFLDDVYECFEDPKLAEEFMTLISNDVHSFIPLVAQRCVMSGWQPA